MLTYHPVVSWQKVSELTESMEENGWQGAPLVVADGEYLITGTHRYTAASRNLNWSDYQIPTIELAEVFAEDGKDFEALHAEYGSPTIGETGMFEALLGELSYDICQKYGIDYR